MTPNAIALEAYAHLDEIDAELSRLQDRAAWLRSELRSNEATQAVVARELDLWRNATSCLSAIVESRRIRKGNGPIPVKKAPAPPRR